MTGLDPAIHEKRNPWIPGSSPGMTVADGGSCGRHRALTWAVVSGRQKFRTARLVARSWRAEDLPFAMELWGDPAVMALIDARGRLTADEVEEKLHAEIERERTAGVQYWALSERQGGGFVGCCGLRPWVYTPDEQNFEVGFHIVKRCWGQGFALEAAEGALDLGWRELRLAKIYAGHHPDNQGLSGISCGVGHDGSKGAPHAATQRTPYS